MNLIVDIPIVKKSDKKSEEKDGKKRREIEEKAKGKREESQEEKMKSYDLSHSQMMALSFAGHFFCIYESDV